MKSREINEKELAILKKFFTEDLANYENNLVECMSFAQSIFDQEKTDVIVYDISENIKFVVIIILENGNMGLLKTVEEFIICIENESVENAKEIDFLL